MGASADVLYRRLLIAAFALAALAYLVQLPTPVRLHNDTIVFVNMAESAVSGRGFLHHGTAGHYALGYPAIVALMLKLGIFHVWTALALNFLFLGLGLWAAAQFVPHGGIVALVTLLSFVVIKHATMPLTDLIFFGVAMLCLLTMQRGRLAIAFILILVAIALRHNGVALVPPLLWLLYKRRPILILPVLAAVALISIRVASLLKPFNRVVAGHTMLDSALQILQFRFTEFGEIAVNLPSVALPPVGQTILPWIGVLMLVLVAGGIWIRRKAFGPAELFFLGFAAILFVWPYVDPRFWIPVLPLIFGYASVSIERLLPKELIAAYLMVFAMLGVAVLVVSTRITYSGSNFPNAYGNAQFHSTYCAYYGNCAFDPQEIDADGLHLLRTYR